MSTKAAMLKIGIIGAGFAGTALAANLIRFSQRPLEIILFEKNGNFGPGEAYSTPFAFHLLNVRARDMSAFEDEPNHFVTWLEKKHYQLNYLDKALPLAERFVPRGLYGQYLQDLLQSLFNPLVSLRYEKAEVIDAVLKGEEVSLRLQDNRQVLVDQAILAIGNNPPGALPFPTDLPVNNIIQPWDYEGPKKIPKQDPLLIIGTGLSMIDAVLTLRDQGRAAPIYAVSRHGLLPLPHADCKVPFLFMREQLPGSLRALTAYMRSKAKTHEAEGGDWRSVINALRAHIPALWAKAELADKKQFLRHLLPYWNIHRHRVHNKVADLLVEMSQQQQLTIFAGRVEQIKNNQVHLRLRGNHQPVQKDVKWIINCMGPGLSALSAQPLIQALIARGYAILDALKIGLATHQSGQLKNATSHVGAKFYALAGLRKGEAWEVGAVPEIRKQCFELGKYLLGVQETYVSDQSNSVRSQRHSS